MLSYTRAREEVSWQKIEGMLGEKEPIHSSIIGYNKGGLIVPVAGLRGFVPASQISLSRRAGMSGETPDQRWSKMVGEDIDVCVIEVDRERRRLILSERAASSETRELLKERVIEELKEGEERNGRVTSLADFGAFVNINGADGLVHLSEISWDRINHPSEVLTVGQDVKVKVISIDREKKRIGLSIRQLQDDPWTARTTKYQMGMLVEATITRLTKFGAFARLERDLEGLIHISEISERRIEHPKEVLKEGDTVTLRIIKIDPANHRIGLSLRRVDSQAYADLDWQSLEEVMDDLADDNPVDASNEAEAVEASAPAVEASAPAETSAPVVEDSAPVVEASVPVVEDSAPAETSAPVVEDSAPAETSAPVVEESAPAETSEPAEAGDTAETSETGESGDAEKSE